MAASFSYAQAAKGIVSTQPSAKTTPAEPTKAVSKPEDQNADSTSQPEADTVISKTEESQETENMAVSADKELADKESGPTAAVDVNVSGTSSPSVDTSSTSTLPKDEEGSATPNGTSESTWDKQSQASGSEKPNSAEGTKDTKDKATAEKEKKAAPLKELKAAPLPAVNIWQQRKEAQEAKAKATAALKPAAKTGTTKAASTASSTSGDNQQDASKVSKKKGADTASEGVKDKKKAEVGKGREDSSRKSGSRSGRQVKANSDSPDVSVPPVGDAALWPTPQVAQGEEKKKSQGKTDKSDKAEKSPVIRPHGKEKWTPVPYVPTAVFNTPLPSAARRGGRAARTGRDSGRNGAQGAGAPVVAEKAISGQAAQSSTAKPPAERGRNEPNSARANSLPAPAKRSNSADAGLTDSRKTTQAVDRSRGPKGAENANPAPTGKHGNGGENFQRQKHDGKPFARNNDAAHKGGDHSKNSHVSADAHTGPRAGSTPDRRLENGPKSVDAAGFHADRKENPRADRGRGSHRGRGGHSGFGGSQNSQFPNNHVSHHSFVHQKPFGFNDRQRSQHGLPNGSQRGHPLSLRSPSLPSSASMYGVYPFPADINTVYNYQPMSAGPMSAVPYQHYMEPFSLMSMISMQLEYYFSVDNLCKDLFLRKQMDSQGFVPLSVIASFKRIKTLTEDYELLRHVCRQLRNVEYQVGEDGVDRLRSRERWEQWVLPIDQRDLSAQHEGPPPTTNTGKPDEQNHVEGATNGLPNGTAESHVLKTSLSSTAPEFSPSTFVNAQNEIANELLAPHCHALNDLSHLLFARHADTFKTAGGLASYTDSPYPRISAVNLSSLVVNNAESNKPYESYLPTLWVKERGTPLESLSSDFVHESYNVFRSRVLEERSLTSTQDGDRDMDALYQFWSHFLVQNFNSQMYNEFKSLALDDLSARNASNGFNRLIRNYGAFLSSNRILPDEGIQDLIDFESLVTKAGIWFSTLYAQPGAVILAMQETAKRLTVFSMLA